MGGKVDALRRIKTAEEIEYLAQAEHIGDVAFSRILDFLKPGVSELEVAAELEYQMKKAGAEDLGFNTIIASGLNSSMPHAIPGRKKLEAGDFVTMDFGCKYEGYCSDMTRTAVNITGDAVCTTIVAYQNNDFNTDVFNDKECKDELFA